MTVPAACDNCLVRLVCVADRNDKSCRATMILLTREIEKHKKEDS